MLLRAAQPGGQSRRLRPICYPEARRSSPSRRGEAESGGAERPPVLDASLDAIKAALPSDPVVDAAAEIISTETIAEGEPITAADAL